MARRVRRVWFGVLGEPSDLSSMDDSTDRGGPQALRTVQAGILHSLWAEFPWAKSEAKVEQGVGGGGGLSGGWTGKRRVPGVDPAQDYLG